MTNEKTINVTVAKEHMGEDVTEDQFNNYIDMLKKELVDIYPDYVVVVESGTVAKTLVETDGFHDMVDEIHRIEQDIFNGFGWI